MARPRSGIGFIQNNTVYTGVRLRGGTRWTCPVDKVKPPPQGIAPGVTWAKAVSLELQALYDRGEWSPPDRNGRNPEAPRSAPAAPTETVEKWFDRWWSDRKARGVSSVRTDRSRYFSHVHPILGALSIRDVQREDIERLVFSLDESTRKGQSWRTSWNGWALALAMFRDASRSKNPQLRVRNDNPCLGVAPPDRGPKKVKQYIGPTEFLALVSADSGVVPLEFRRLYALAVYLFARPGELEALEWSDLDLERGTVHIHRAVHYDTGDVKPVKTQEARRFAFEPNLLPLLRAMHAEVEGKGRVLRSPVPKESAKFLRKHLKAAGVTRPDLFTSDVTRKAMTFYDLRATGITWRAIRGDNPMQIQRAAGHTGFDTTSGYIREAESVREGFGTVFPALPTSLLGGSVTAPSVTPPASSVTDFVTEKQQTPRDSSSTRGSGVRGGGLEGAAESPSVGKCVELRGWGRPGRAVGDTWRTIRYAFCYGA